jgi:DNA repair protein RadC
VDIRRSRLELVIDDNVHRLTDERSVVDYILDNVEMPTPGTVARHLSRIGLSRAPQEIGWVMALSNKLDAYALIEVARGNSCRLRIDKPVLYAAVLATGADRFIFIHNHPGSDPTPSDDDISMTQEIADGADLLGLRFEDHYIVTADPASYASLRSMGLYEVINASDL